jgi:hypothetical protein
MSVTRSLLLAACAAVIAGHAARAEIFDHLSTSASPSTYEGRCPVAIKLESVIKFEVSFNRREQYVYRWEDDVKTLTDDVTTYSTGRTNRVEGSILVRGPVGKTVTVPVRLHAFWGTGFSKTHPFYGRSVNDHYSLPASITLTCRS